MKNKNKIIYWVFTGLLSAMMLMNVIMYFAKHDMVSQTFESIGYPIYLIYPLAIAKLLGIIAILTKKSVFLKEWAYAGFFFDFIIAASAHLNAGDGQFAPAIVALVLLMGSYSMEKKAFS